MSLNADEMHSMKEEYRELSTDTLLDHIVNEAGDFRPEALELMQDELRSRGLTSRDIDQFRAHRPMSQVVAVAAFEERLFAEQARDVLDQRGVASLLVDRRSSGPNEFPTPGVEGYHVVLVPADDEVKARLLLETFAPAAEVAGEEE